MGDEMAPEQGAEAGGMEPPPEDPALTGASDPENPQMNQDLPPEENPYMPQAQQPLQFSRKFMGTGGVKRSKKKDPAKYAYHPPFAMVDVGV